MRYTQPVAKARSEAYAIYPSLPETAIGARAVAVMSDTIVTGPVDICGHEPNNAAMITGINAVYKPTSIGSPANCAYAID